MVKAKVNKRTQRNLAKRRSLWPELKDEMIWSWREKDGFVSIPRAMPYFYKIMDDCSKSKPLSSTYFALWCRCWDESGLIKITAPEILAWESGFGRTRALNTWRTRIRILEKLGFIKTKEFGSLQFGFVVLLNPYKIVKKLFAQKKFTDEGWQLALQERASEIKATDLEEE